MSNSEIYDEDYEALRDAPLDLDGAVWLEPSADVRIGFRVDFLDERLEAVQAAANEWGVAFQEAAHRLVDEALAAHGHLTAKR